MRMSASMCLILMEMTGERPLEWNSCMRHHNAFCTTSLSCAACTSCRSGICNDVLVMRTLQLCVTMLGVHIGYCACVMLPCALLTGDPTTLPFLMMVLIISKGVGDRFNYSVFHHQIMLKGFSYVGGIPEHLIKRAHLDVRDFSAHCCSAACCLYPPSGTV